MGRFQEFHLTVLLKVFVLVLVTHLAKKAMEHSLQPMEHLLHPREMTLQKEDLFLSLAMALQNPLVKVQ
jgi:hypothetical protein